MHQRAQNSTRRRGGHTPQKASSVLASPRHEEEENSQTAGPVPKALQGTEKRKEFHVSGCHRCCRTVPFSTCRTQSVACLRPTHNSPHGVHGRNMLVRPEIYGLTFALHGNLCTPMQGARYRQHSSLVVLAGGRRNARLL